jgi:23S rRNA (pseudouridine1915-N3)-methyltransferase
VTIDIVCAGKSPKPHEQAWIDEYLRRLTRLGRVNLVRVRERVRATPEETARATWKEMEARIPERAWRILLDPSGEPHSTRDLARLLVELERRRHPSVAFVLGGSYGLPDEARAGAHTLLSFGPLTLPHRIALLVLVEQIYRVFSVKAGTPYHHE